MSFYIFDRSTLWWLCSSEVFKLKPQKSATVFQVEVMVFIVKNFNLNHYVSNW